MSIPAACLEPEFTCVACGGRHAVSVREIIYAADALHQLPAVCRRRIRGTHLGLLADTRTLVVAGETAATALRAAGFSVQITLIPDPAPGLDPVCDDRTYAWLQGVCPGADGYVAAGSGVVNDLTKWLSSDRQVPYVCVPTAASMNGYASDNVASTIKGVKCLGRGRGPAAILATPEILRAAPWRMTAAGLGDVMAKPVSSADWRLNNLLFGERFCEFCVDLIRDAEPRYLEHPAALRAGDSAALDGLFDALTLTGLSMSMMGTSAPASGGEHLVSHSLDMLAVRDGRQHDLHGRQVGVATILAAALYEQVLAVEKPVFAMPDAAPDPAFWGTLHSEVASQWAKKRPKYELVCRRLEGEPGLWPAVRAALLPMMRPPRRLKDCLAAAGAAHTLADIGVSRDSFIEVFQRAADIRERFTILDLARITGVFPAVAPRLVDRWV